ncbi:Cytochrome P450 [Mycena sanguinolenta]|uniref:Cytochrome P450 n=1 Tax=Mycena sanguinolenta TaxID=230812 RepID=A0A8H6Z8V9_9AGAR|nr:Cytochrome P450 [Mycena sanguinolenta]
MDSRWTLIMTIAAITFAYSFRRRRTPPLPLGPRGLPIVGNILDVPTSQPWLKFAKLGEIWGEISSLTVLGQTMIIVNSLEVAEDLLETHGVNFSDRPVLPMAGELMGFDNIVTLVQYGDRVKRERKLYHQLFGNSTSIISRFGPLLTSEVHKFLQSLLGKPEEALKLIERMTGAITVMDTGPFSQQATVDTSCEHVKEQLAAGNIEPSFTASLLEEGSHEEYLIKWAAFVIQGGGADTVCLHSFVPRRFVNIPPTKSSAQIKAFFRAMSLYPEVQAAAQKDIDAVVGTDRLPDISDRGRLPYVNALCKEILRYHVSVPTGFAHRARADFIYERGEGATPMLIPKDSFVIPNIWKMTHDPARYTNPMVFDPARFIEKTGKAAELDPTRISFGFGRRICPGKVLAETILFLTCSAVLSVFNISKARENGIIIEPPLGQTTGTMSHPLPFKCSVEPRNDRAAALIRSAYP